MPNIPAIGNDNSLQDVAYETQHNFKKVVLAPLGFSGTSETSSSTFYYKVQGGCRKREKRGRTRTGPWGFLNGKHPLLELP